MREDAPSTRHILSQGHIEWHVFRALAFRLRQTFWLPVSRILFRVGLGGLLLIQVKLAALTRQGVEGYSRLEASPLTRLGDGRNNVGVRGAQFDHRPQHVC